MLWKGLFYFINFCKHTHELVSGKVVAVHKSIDSFVLTELLLKTFGIDIHGK